MQFVNIHGRPVDTTPVKQAAKSKATQDEAHKGYLAVGYSPEQIEAGRVAHEAEISAAIANKRVPPQPWSVEAFMRKTKPRKIRTQPYFILDAAKQACVMAAKQLGWINCRVEPVIKGGGK